MADSTQIVNFHSLLETPLKCKGAFFWGGGCFVIILKQKTIRKERILKTGEQRSSVNLAKQIKNT